MHKEFQDLRYTLEPAPAMLADMVDGYWAMHNPTAEARPFQVLPDGCCKLIVLERPGQPRELRLSGLWTQAFPIEVAAHTRLLGLRFRPLATEYLLGRPVPLNAREMLPPDFWNLHLLPTLALPEAAPWLTALLTERLAHATPEPRKVQLFRLLRAGQGSVRVDELASATGWAARQINRYFQQQYGLPLKAYGNVLRAYAAVQQLQPADLFPSGAYYDQSHGIREIRRLTGASPRQLHQHRHDRFIQLCPPLPPELCPS